MIIIITTLTVPVVNFHWNLIKNNEESIKINNSHRSYLVSLINSTIEQVVSCLRSKVIRKSSKTFWRLEILIETYTPRDHLIWEAFVRGIFAMEMKWGTFYFRLLNKGIFRVNTSIGSYRITAARANNALSTLAPH